MYARRVSTYRDTEEAGAVANAISERGSELDELKESAGFAPTPELAKQLQSSGDRVKYQHWMSPREVPAMAIFGHTSGK